MQQSKHSHFYLFRQPESLSVYWFWYAHVIHARQMTGTSSRSLTASQTAIFKLLSKCYCIGYLLLPNQPFLVPLVDLCTIVGVVARAYARLADLGGGGLGGRGYGDIGSAGIWRGRYVESLCCGLEVWYLKIQTNVLIWWGNRERSHGAPTTNTRARFLTSVLSSKQFTTSRTLSSSSASCLHELKFKKPSCSRSCWTQTTSCGEINLAQRRNASLASTESNEFPIAEHIGDGTRIGGYGNDWLWRTTWNAYVADISACGHGEETLRDQRYEREVEINPILALILRPKYWCN